MTAPDPVVRIPNPSPRVSRRGLLVLGTAGIVAGGVGAARWYNIFGDNAASGTMTPPEAHRAARAGRVLLVDIRRPDEWARTGLAEGAVPLDMRRADFEGALVQSAGGDRSRPVALICARGVRSRHMTERLHRAGFVNVIDVPEGMLGSGAGPGWLKRALPVVRIR